MASTMISEETLNLANLPADVIRKLISIELESFNYLRLISPLWNSLALEHLAYSKNLPVIYRLDFYILASGVRNLAITLPPSYLDYFFIGKSHPKVNHDNETTTVPIYSKGLTEHEFTVKCSKIMRQLVGRSKRINFLVLRMDINNDVVNMMKELFNGASVDKISFPRFGNFDQMSANIIRDFVCSCREPVRKLIVSFKNDTLESDALGTLERLTTDVSARVETYQINLIATANADMLLANFETSEISVSSAMRERVKRVYTGLGFNEVQFQAGKSARGDVYLDTCAGARGVVIRFPDI